MAILILGLTPNFTSDELRNRFLMLSKISHPDTSGDKQLFQIISESYEFLKKCKQQEQENVTCNKKNNPTNSKETSSNKTIEELKNEILNLNLLELSFDKYFNMFFYDFPIMVKYKGYNLPFYSRDLSRGLIVSENIEVTIKPLFSRNTYSYSGKLLFKTNNIPTSMILEVPESFKRYIKTFWFYKFNINVESKFQGINIEEKNVFIRSKRSVLDMPLKISSFFKTFSINFHIKYK